MKLTKKNLQRFIKRGREYQQKAQTYCLAVLERIDHPIDFDWDGADAPCLNSTHFGDDVADCYIEKAWLDGGLIKVNLYAYYIGERRYDIDLADECNADYLDLLDYLLNEIK